jgi:FkbH-like protein
VNENIINNDKKIKCIVWDLDNTLWNGILIEDKEIKLNDDIINIIIELDKRGIFSSIVSKNDYDLAYSKLKEFQIDGYFVFPKINWDPKSVNIKQLSIDTNIGLDTIAFVDDNPFERDEVKNVCPDVLCIDVKDVNTILNMKEFDVIITSDTVKRRKTYKMIEEQKKEIEKWNGNIDDFIKSCNMKLLIRKPKIDELVRCYELIQRTNQLNSSGRRLSIIDIENIYNNKNYETYILQCEDKYGDYGIVGFSIVHIIEQPIITDFVISCRVANRKVENAYIIYLVEKYKKMGYLKLSINYKKTIKNGPIFNVIKDLNMLKGENEDVNIESYYILLKNDVIKLSIIEVIDNFESI